jgi:glycosyltransferase involved in cell wall biosynthesis
MARHNLMTLISLDRYRSSNDLPENQKTSPRRFANKRIKVMYVISDLSIGGAEMMLYKLLVETNRERFQPVVVSLVDHGALRERIEALGIPVHTTRMKPGRPTPAGLWRLVRLISSIQPDLILGQMYHSCLAAQVAGSLSGRRIPILWTIHSSISSPVTEKRLTAVVIKLCGLLSRLPAKIIFVSRVGREQHRSLGYYLENSCVIPNGIDEREFVPSARSRLSVRSELGLPEDAFLIGLIGRYHPMKDHDNFLKAAALISGTHPETHFLLIGRGVDHGTQSLCESIKELGLAGRVHLLGERQDIPRLSAALDVFTLCSSYGESCPNVIGEAMACGVPCVVTDIGDAAWLVGQTGRVVPPRNARALAEAWQEMIELDPQHRRALGVLARSRVVEHFPMHSVLARYEGLVETVLRGEVSGDSKPQTAQAIEALVPTLEETK